MMGINQNVITFEHPLLHRRGKGSELSLGIHKKSNMLQ